MAWHGQQDAGASAGRWPELPTGTSSPCTVPKNTLFMGSLCSWHEFVRSQSSSPGKVPACISPLAAQMGSVFSLIFFSLLSREAPHEHQQDKADHITDLHTAQCIPNSSIFHIPVWQVRTTTAWQSQGSAAFPCCGQRCQPQPCDRSPGTDTDARLQGSRRACQFPEKFRCHPAPSQQAAAFPGRELYF